MEHVGRWEGIVSCGQTISVLLSFYPPTKLFNYFLRLLFMFNFQYLQLSLGHLTLWNRAHFLFFSSLYRHFFWEKGRAADDWSPRNSFTFQVMSLDIKHKIRFSFRISGIWKQKHNRSIKCRTYHLYFNFSQKILATDCSEQEDVYTSL